MNLHLAPSDSARHPPQAIFVHVPLLVNRHEAEHRDRSDEEDRGEEAHASCIGGSRRLAEFPSEDGFHGGDGHASLLERRLARRQALQAQAREEE
jgi:hypothetical protein